MVTFLCAACFPASYLFEFIIKIISVDRVVTDASPILHHQTSGNQIAVTSTITFSINFPIKIQKRFKNISKIVSEQITTILLF